MPLPGRALSRGKGQGYLVRPPSGTVCALVMAAGRGARMGAGRNKQYLPLAGRPLLTHALEAFERADVVDSVIVVAHPEEVDLCRETVVDAFGARKVASVVAGGHERQDSVRLGLQALPPDCRLVLVHDGARPLVSVALIERVAERAWEVGAATAAVPLVDTLKMVDERLRVVSTPDRSAFWRTQTPQGFRREVIEEAHSRAVESGLRATDDCALVEALGLPVEVVLGDTANIKVTTESDLALAEVLLSRKPQAEPPGASPEVAPVMRSGVGYDVHRLVEGRPLVLGGVEIPFPFGLLGHSDADVLVHAVCDAILGAAGLGDIGRHFPDSDPTYAGISSLKLLARVGEMVRRAGFSVCNVDAVVVAERPKIAPFSELMRANIARTIGVEVDAVNVKGTTTEGLGFTGRSDGMAAHAVALLRQTTSKEL